MKALVTGASGHLGANLVRALISRQWEVRALVHNDTRALDGLDIEPVQGDILDPDSLRKAFTGIDIAFHLAARISLVKKDRFKVEEMNITGVRNVIDACISANVKRLVHTSSFHCRVQEPLDEPFDETRPFVSHPKHPPYNLAKARGEQLVHQAIEQGLDAVIVIPSGIIGPYDYYPSHFGATLLNIALRKLRILINAGLDWVDARDVAGGMISAAEKAGTGEKFLLTGHTASLQEVAGYIAEFMSISPPRIIAPYSLAKAVVPAVSAWNNIFGKRQLFTKISLEELNSNQNLCHDKASELLGYQPRPLKETIFDTLEWFRENGYMGKTGVVSK